MNTISKYFSLIGFLVLAITACGNNANQNAKVDVAEESTELTNQTVSNRFNDMLDSYYEDGLKLKPINATFAGDNRYNDQFVNNLSPEVEQQLAAHYEKYQSELAAFNNADLSESERLSKAVLRWELDINQAAMEFDNDLTPIDQMWSVNLTMGQLASGASAQPFKTMEDYSRWLTRVDAYLEWLASVQTKMKQGIERSYVLPKALTIKVIPQLKAMTKKKVNEHLFFAPAQNIPESFSDQDRQKIVVEYTRMVTDKVIPAYQSLVDFMVDEYLVASRDSSGIDSVPNGDAFYQHQIKLYTTTTMTADEIHQLGLSEVARILSEMEKVKQEVNYEGELKSFFNHVRENKDLMPYTEPQQVLDHYNNIYEVMKPQVETLFDLKPKTPFEVRRTEAFREASASAEYNPGSLDGTRPGIFYTPIPDANNYNVYDSESLFLHEAIPGHHYQISLTQENQELPKFRKTLWYSGYGEGWALYTESLGKELGLYTDPYQYFGMLSAEMHRAIRLVVDTGLHTKGWTREQAIAYSLENEAEAESSIVREIERYMANPGQALSYKIGQLKIRELRTMAEQELGDKFNIAQFHNQILETGCVPLALLEDKIHRWVAGNK